MELMSDYGGYVLLILQALLTWAGWSMRKAFVTKAEFTKLQNDYGTQFANLQTQHNGLVARVEGIEREMKHMPTKDDLHDLQLELGEAVGEIKLARAEYGSIMGLMTRMESVVTRHEQIFVDAARNR